MNKVTKAEIVKAIKRGSDNSGSYGSYFQINGKVGIKVIAFDDECDFKSIEALKQSRVYEDAVKEGKMLKEASKRSRMVAKFYSLETFKVFGYWQVGIVMEHIDGILLSDYCDKDEDAEDYDVRDNIVEMLLRKMRKVKVYIHDQNSSNFIRQGRRWRIIDFSPLWVKVSKLPA